MNDRISHTVWVFLRRCVCGANSGTKRFCAACDATMGGAR